MDGMPSLPKKPRKPAPVANAATNVARMAEYHRLLTEYELQREWHRENMRRRKTAQEAMWREERAATRAAAPTSAPQPSATAAVVAVASAMPARCSRPRIDGMRPRVREHDLGNAANNAAVAAGVADEFGVSKAELAAVSGESGRALYEATRARWYRHAIAGEFGRDQYEAARRHEAEQQEVERLLEQQAKRAAEAPPTAPLPLLACASPSSPPAPPPRRSPSSGSLEAA